MENLSYENLDQLAQHILTANGTTEERNSAAQVLEQMMSTNIVQFIKSLMDLASSERTEGSPRVIPYLESI